LRLGLQDLAGSRRQVNVVAKVKEGKGLVDLTGENSSGNDVFEMERNGEDEARLMRARFQEYGDQLLVIKLPRFLFSESEVGSMIGKARKHRNLIVDLRGNPGGRIDTLKWLIGGMFDKEVKIADRVGRKEMKAEIAKPMHDPFTGKVAVLVDANSASAAELFARTMQIEKRAIIVGDRTSGSVMEARPFNEQMGTDKLIFYGAMITVADLVMTDGKSLEHRGVTPDELLLPGVQDIANGRDPVLAHAAELLGVKISPEEAGKIFPYEWPNL
jgi:C-terminal processing protease CtpA/Prc